MANTYNNNRRQQRNTAPAQKQHKAPKPRISARIDRLVDYEDSNVKAYASVTDGVFAIKDIRVMDSKKGLFVQMPQRSYTQNGETKYVATAHPVSAEAREVMIDEVMKAYDQALIDSMKEDQDESESEDYEESEDGDLDFDDSYAPQMAQSM